MIEQVICKLVNKFRRVFGNIQLPEIYVLDDLPETHKGNTIYVTSIKGINYYCSMKCPCGCEDVIELNLNPLTKPKWYIEWHLNGTISLSPSVNRTVGCKSHFFYKMGTIKWSEPNRKKKTTFNN